MAAKRTPANLLAFINQHPRAVVSTVILMGAGLLTCKPVLAQTSARLPANALPVQARDWLQKGTVASYSVNGVNATVNLTAPATVLHWTSMDVGADATLRFRLPSTTSRVLNKVDGGALDNMTTINGALKANGQVYIYNPNGILFGLGAQVNVNSLVATSLKIDDQRFMAGILSPNASAVFASDPAFGRRPGDVMVEGDANGGVLQRAAITAQTNGLIMLVAPNVTNAGKLSAPDGQVVLAAGSKVYLAAPQDSSVRGLRVEVGSEGLETLAGVTAATNAVTGQLNVQRGNITMVGLAVNQMGRASATTSVNLNGSIFLRAQDGAVKGGPNSAAVATRGGTLVLGQGSSTTVLPTLDDTATATAPPAGQVFKPSLVDLAGSSVTLGEKAVVLAPSGNVTITARANPGQADLKPNSSHVEIAAGSLIDVSGSTGTVLAMESNVVTAELRGSELADNLLLRDSAIRGTTVRLDRRKVQSGIAVANVTGYLNLVEQNVGENTATGGSVTVTSEGDITQRDGSRIDVSGGWVDYAAGHVNTSKLSLAGRLYNIETAPANLLYDGVVNLANSSSSYEAGYREGKNSGSIQFNAPALTLSGALSGKATFGERQRDLGAASRPLGGQLSIGNVGAVLDATTGRASFSAPDQFGFTGKLGLGASAGVGALNLDLNALAGAGFSRINAVTSGDIAVGSTAAMAAGGQLRLGAGGQLDWSANLSMSGGAVTASAFNGLNVMDGVSINLAGTWQNDMPLSQPARDANGLLSGRASTRGGNLRLFANQLSVGDDVRMDVSGGALLSAAGSLSAGDAGSITLQATTQSASLDASLKLGERLELSGYGVSRGGSLSLTGRNVVIAPGADAAAGRRARGEDLYLSDDLFSIGGFSSVSVTANGNLTVSGGASIAPRVQSWLLKPDSRVTPSGSMGSVASGALLPLAGPAGQRQSGNLSLRASGRPQPGDGLGVLSLGTGSSVLADPGATVTLSADRQVLLDGTVQARGGSISALLLAGQPGSLDDNYDSSRSIWLGANSRLDASGSAERVYVNGAGIASGEVLDGGSIRLGRTGSAGLEAAVGYIIAEAGSVMDVSGTSAAGLRFRSGSGVTEAKLVGSAGGSVNVSAREGLLLAGQLHGQAGTGEARGGTLTVSLDREDRSGGTAYPQDPRELVLTAASAAEIAPAGLRMGAAVTGLDGKGLVPVSTFADAGFANLVFKSQDAITLAGSAGSGAGALALSAPSSIELNAPNLRAAAAGGAQPTKVRITAPYVNLGNTDARYQLSASAQDGGASLAVSATTLDLSGNSATQGFGSVRLSAADDIRLIGSTLDETVGAPGSFVTGSHLTLHSAQVYPTTLSSFALALTGNDTALSFQGNGRAAEPVLSAAGSVSAIADNIVQGGRVVAPFGRITLEARDELRYEPGSVTSVAGNGSVPFGTVVNGRDWIYELGSQTISWRVNPETGSALNELGLPSKKIVSKAPSVVQSNGAVLDLSGGGSLYAYEFSPGPGGSGDVLQASGGAANRTFAINPNYKSSVAPRDWQYGSDGLKAGDQVWLSGTNGLAAGFYTLLPAHYALLPGGFAIEPAAGTRDMSAGDNRVNADSSLIIAGYRRSSTDGSGDTRMTGFTLSPSSLVRRRSEFKDFSADSFFQAEAARLGVTPTALPADGGQAVFEVKQRLTLDGSTRLSGAGANATAAAGIGGSVDISAPLINVVSNRRTDSGGYVTLLADDLVAMNAKSLLLGGLRTNSAGAVQLQVTGETVRIDNDSAHSLTGAEFIFAATDTVQLTSKASVVASLAAPGASGDIVVGGEVGNFDGALLRASAGAPVRVQRPANDGRRGRLDIAQGARVAADGSLYLDATQSMSFAGGLELRDGSALGVHAPSIALGSDAPRGPDTVTFDAAGLRSLARLGSLDLTSYSSIDAWGKADLGSASMESLTLSAATLQSRSADLRLTAKNLFLAGSATGGAAPQPDSSTGSLSAVAQSVELGSGEFRIKGFATAKLSATGEILATGSTSALVTDNELTLSASRIGTGLSASGSFIAGGALTLQSARDPVVLPASSPGGSLGFYGDTIRSSARISAPAGQIEMIAANGVRIDAGGLDVRGVNMAFGSTLAHAPAGRITLDAGAGNMSLAAAATVDLSAQGAAAGELLVRAAGRSSATVDLQGTLLGAAAAVSGETQTSVQGGRFVLDVAQAPSAEAFEALNTKLNSAGFTESRSIRVRQGDLKLGAQGLVTAHNISLATDNGSIELAGTLDARGAAGGVIEIHAAQSDSRNRSGNITLDSTARLLASATQAADSAAGSVGDGGRVVLGTANADGSAAAASGGASLLALQGSSIDVSGQGAGQSGTVLLRAPRIGSDEGADVAIQAFRSTVSGSRATTIEAVKVYSASTISNNADSATNLDASLNGRMASDSDGFMRSQGTVATRLGRSDLILTPGIEVRSQGDLTVSVNETAFERQDRGWNLNPWRFGGQAGTLSLRAGGTLAIRGSISDGFVKGSSLDAMPNWSLDTSDKSWSLRLAGGADLAAANPLAVTPSAARGDVRISFVRSAGNDDTSDTPVALVRTGTGRIDIAAGRDFELGTVTRRDPDGDVSLDRVFGAAVYTAGHRVPLATGFAAPVNAANALYGAGALSAAAFGVQGGGIAVFAQRDVIGAPAPQLVNNWLFRQGRSGLNAAGELVFEQLQNGTTLNTAWWARPDYFEQGVGTLGGGDINITAVKGSVRDLSVNLATNAYIAGATPAGVLQEQGGGDLSLRAGGDIKGGNFYVQKGKARLHADGSVTAGSFAARDLEAPATSDESVYTALRPVIALGDATLDLSAGRRLEIETVYNPTLARQSVNNVASDLNVDSGFFAFSNTSSSAVNYKQRYAQYSNFSTYSDRTAVKLTAVADDLVLSNNALLVVLSGGAAQPYDDYARALRGLFVYGAPNLRAAALNGNLSSLQGFAMAPSAAGQLDLLAGKSVNLRSNGSVISGISMLDVDPANIATPHAPTLLRDAELKALRGEGGGLFAHTASGLHANDSIPVRVVAQSGSITGQSNLRASLNLPKKAEILAGRDIRDLGFAIQHNRATDETMVRTGRDFIDSTNFANSSPVKHVVTGPGLLSILAGRNLDLGNSEGVVTRGNLDNPYLPEGGAGIVAVAGSTSAPASESQNPFDKLSENEAVFKALVEASKQDDKLVSFDALIAKAFPKISSGGGDINVFGSQFRTEQGGSLDLLAPGGQINAGLVSVPTYLQNKPASEIGIYTVPGPIRMLAGQDIKVNQSRVFALGGGDITVVSQFGNIDAGRGAKTASSAPPPLLTTDANGNTRLDIAGSIAGSGIATLRTSPEQAPGNVYAVAPRGIFDAGDAGVRSTGFVAIQAAVVLNSNNITASAGVSGSPVVSAGGPASAATPAGAANAAQDTLKQVALAPKETLGLSVEVLGYGDADDADADDPKDSEEERKKKRANRAKKL
jgi:filamentous hemagglutinin